MRAIQEQIKRSGFAALQEKSVIILLVRIGLMGGTFDPIHFGHLFIAEEARVRCGLERVIFFPNGCPAPILNKAASSDGEIRLRLIELAIADNPHFQTSRVELDRSGPSFAIDTVEYFQEKYSGAELYYIVGADSINQVLEWHRGTELLEKCRFIVATRPGYDLAIARRTLSKQQLESVVFLEDTPELQIASHILRQRFARGENTRYLLPKSVRLEIENLHLYDNKNQQESYHSQND